MMSNNAWNKFSVLDKDTCKTFYLLSFLNPVPFFIPKRPLHSACSSLPMGYGDNKIHVLYYIINIYVNLY